MRFQDKTEQGQREEVRDLIRMYAKSNGDPVPGGDRLEADVDQIMSNLAARTSRGPVVAGLTGGK